MPAGRPTPYKPEFCELLTEHMRQGLSFESFGGTIGVCRKTLYNWCEVHPEFLYAKQSGQELSLLWWERVNAAHALGKIKTGGANVIFTMKCRHGWREPELETPDLDLNLNYNIE